MREYYREESRRTKPRENPDGIDEMPRAASVVLRSVPFLTWVFLRCYSSSRVRVYDNNNTTGIEYSSQVRTLKSIPDLTVTLLKDLALGILVTLAFGRNVFPPHLLFYSATRERYAIP